MKAKLKNILSLAALGMTLLSNTVPTWAGSVYAPEVSIQQGRTEIGVFGSMVGARYSADGTQSIGCYIDATPFVVCSAQDGAGKFVLCVSRDARVIGAIQGMTDSSAIRVDVNPSNSACTFIGIYDESYYLK
jgi:hypothetical protein